MANIFAKQELNEISSLKAQQLKEIFSEFHLEYTNVEDARKTLGDYIQQNFEKIAKKEGWLEISWNEISNYLPIYEYYNSSSYGNPVQLVASTLKTVYRSYFYDLDEKKREILKTDLTTRKTAIESELDKKIQTELKEKIQQKNKKIQNVKGDYSIDFGSGFQLSSLQADFGQGLRDISNIGEGSKKRLFLAITEWDKEVRSKKEYKKVIRGYDEPDTSLHYSAQKEMYYTLKNLAEQEGVNIQPILCTHSVSMIDRAPPRIINHVKNSNGISTVEYLLGDDDQETKDFLDNVSTISGIANSSLFFERCFLIAEGETEFNALPIVYKKLTGRSFHEDGVVLVNIEGNGSWKSFLKLLNKNKQNATLLFMDSDIQEDGRRNITPQTIREVGFLPEFVKTNVIFVGNQEFEDIFSNDLLTRYLNQFHPKIEDEVWVPDDIASLRDEGKFSDNLQRMVRKYQYDNAIRDNDFKKPEFGIRISEMISIDELQTIPDFTLLAEKIHHIVA